MSARLELLLDPERKAQADAADRRACGFVSMDPILRGLTPAQRQQHHAMLDAMRAAHLRALPSCFGAL